MSTEVPLLSATPIDAIESDWEDRSISARARQLFWMFGVTFGFLGALTTRFAINVDGISYLDLGNAYLNHNWSAAANAYWSPLYACLLAAAIWLFHASLYWESTIVHVVNFVILLASMAAFEFFLGEVCHRQDSFASREIQPVPIWTTRILGYSLFLYAALIWISVGNVTPDQCVATVMYLVAGLLLRMQRGNVGWGSYAILGLLLGFGYPTKAALFPLGLFSLATTPFLGMGVKLGSTARLARALLATCLFVLVASPLLVALSRAKGRFTFGDTGKLAYALYVDNLPDAEEWQGGGIDGMPKHPIRKISVNPSVYEFAVPVGGTYPPYYDASYWLEGVKTHIDLRGQAQALLSGARVYIACVEEQGGFLVTLLALIALDSNKYSYWRLLGSTWPSWIVSLAGLALFSLVLVETRYVGSFLVIIAISCLGAIRLRPSVRTRRVMTGLSLAVAALCILGIAAGTTRNLYSSVFRPRQTQWEVAQALKQYGIRPGDGVATIVDHTLGDYWAYLAQAKIIEDIPLKEMPELATLTPESRARFIQTLRGPGAKAIVTTPAPPSGTGLNWARLGDTDYFIFPLGPGSQQ